MQIDTNYFRQYRSQLGFSNQNDAKTFFAAKDVTPSVDYGFIALLNERLFEIIQKINTIVDDEIKEKNLSKFRKEKIEQVYTTLKNNQIISRLNNQGRRPEQVYFSWMRGFLISSYFIPALSQIFNVDIDQIAIIGDDDFNNIENFKRTPKADLQIILNNGQVIRVEVQSGFQGINDIKQHKVLEAQKLKNEEQIASIVVHFDLYNGQVAFVRIDEIEDENINWITRQQMEGQTVFNIDQNYFVWKLMEKPPKLSTLSLNF